MGVIFHYTDLTVLFTVAGALAGSKSNTDRRPSVQCHNLQSKGFK